MNNVHWFIHQKDTDDNLQKLIYTIQESGMIAHSHPYNHTMDWSFLPTDQPVIIYGSISLVRHAMKNGSNNQHFYPCAWLDLETLTCRSYYSYWGKYLLQKDYAFYPLAEIFRLKDYLFEKFGTNNQIFIRPDANNKEFNGEIVSKEKFNHWKDVANWYNPPQDILCVVAKPETIIAEYRLIIADKKVIAGSQYRRDGIEYHPNYPIKAATLAEEVAETWSPHPIYCLDIAETPTGFKVLECGSLNCAGFYKANLTNIVNAANNIAIREWKEIYGT